MAIFEFNNFVLGGQLHQATLHYAKKLTQHPIVGHNPTASSLVNGGFYLMRVYLQEELLRK